MFYCFQNEISLAGTQSFSIFRVGYLKKVRDGSGTGIPSGPDHLLDWVRLDVHIILWSGGRISMGMEDRKKEEVVDTRHSSRSPEAQWILFSFQYALGHNLLI